MPSLKEVVKSFATIFQTLKYGNGGKGNPGSPQPGETPRGKVAHLEIASRRPVSLQMHPELSRKLSASEGNLAERPLTKGQASPNGRQPSKQMSKASLQKRSTSKSVSDVPKVVAHMIHEASNSPNTSLLARQPIRVINGAHPSMQSQVLLNTKTSQPFEDLVRDLALSVKIPTQPLGNVLQTLTGRQIRGYSQLRSELKAGQRAFFIYFDGFSNGTLFLYPQEHRRTPSRTRNKQLAKTMLGKVNSNSSSDISAISPARERRRSQPRLRSHSPTPTPRVPSKVSETRSPH